MVANGEARHSPPNALHHYLPFLKKNRLHPQHSTALHTTLAQLPALTHHHNFLVLSLPDMALKRINKELADLSRYVTFILSLLRSRRHRLAASR